MTKVRAMLALVAILFALPARGGEQLDLATGNDLYRWCIPGTPDVTSGHEREMGQWMRCHGFVAGISHVLGLWQLSDPQLAFSNCPPEGVTAGQRLAVVHRYVTEHPAARHEPAYYLVLAALHEAFPCPVASEIPSRPVEGPGE